MTSASMNYGKIPALTLLLLLNACQGDASESRATESANDSSNSMEGSKKVRAMSVANKQISTNEGKTTAMESPNHIPGEIQALISSGSRILVYKTLDLTGDGHEDAVIIVKNEKAESENGEESNPCALMIFQRMGDTLQLAGKNDHVVDCVLNDVVKDTENLVDALELQPNSITYTNQGAKSNSSYSFKYLSERKSWYVASLVNNYPEYDEASDEMEVIRESANYPDDFGWIPMSSFDPGMLADVMEKSRTAVD